MYTALVAIQVVLAIGIIALVLMQHGKGADAGAAFGSGASGTVFGSRGSANFLSRSTGILAGFFFLVSLVLAVIVARGQAGTSSVVDSLAVPAQQQSVAPEYVEDEAAAESAPTTPGAPE